MDKRSCADGNMDIYIYIYVHGWKHAVHAVFHWRCKHKLITWVHCSALSSSTQQVTQDSWQRHWFCVASRGDRSNANCSGFFFGFFFFFLVGGGGGWGGGGGMRLKCEQCIHQNIAMKVFCRLVCKLQQSGPSGRGIGYANLGLYGNQITIPDHPNSRYKLSGSEV